MSPVRDLPPMQAAWPDAEIVRMVEMTFSVWEASSGGGEDEGLESALLGVHELAESNGDHGGLSCPDCAWAMMSCPWMKGQDCTLLDG
jgi:hypothetical protein